MYGEYAKTIAIPIYKVLLYLVMYDFPIWCSFTEIFVILFAFHVFSAIKLLKAQMT